MIQSGFLIALFLLAWSASSQATLHPREPLPKLTIDPGKLDFREIRQRREKIASGRRPGKDIVLYAQGPIQVDYEENTASSNPSWMRPNRRIVPWFSG